ncbi:uncharacterized protein PV09_09346 [Verruconis gallopava]|uniref:Uncharacterized protein n=1 Tax=Verruconis gallopava TaxID=253628 RepID=A0A0D1X9N8_9PEZI|nr:uncharacterized protein PV09_09346 [Verruconis gallopava]KIV98900.1 hypothetical protein PV09_09346 [Verruconis gallopava]
MRLINVHTLHLEEFSQDKVPRYAILSHTWGSDEVLFDDLQTEDRVLLSDRQGFWKVKSCCEQVCARPGRIDYVWVDTCCIDKKSSAELSEAINSMFQYYAGAEYCLVYLEDFEDDASPALENLKHCRWFTRGWTLQELIAPSDVYFMSKGWKPLGRRSELAAVISQITGIALNIMNEDILTGGASLTFQHASFAQRMSWVSRRSTTREEDMAYCLLGLFDISMPVLYGEGLIKAFRRLQEEIVKTSSDHSLFVHDSASTENRSILAETPKAFANYGNVVQFQPDWLSEVSPFSLTNRGVQLEVPLRLHPHGAVAVLACRYRGDFRGPLGLELERSRAHDGNYQRRANPPHVVMDFTRPGEGDYKITSIYVSQKIEKVKPDYWTNSPTNIWFRVPNSDEDWSIVKAWPFWFWNATYQTFSIDVNRIWDQHYNDHLTLPLKHLQLLRKQAKGLRIPAIAIVSNNHDALGSVFGHVVVVTLKPQRLTSNALCPDVDFDAFPLHRRYGRLEEIDIEDIVNEIDIRRWKGHGIEFSPDDADNPKLQSVPGQAYEDIQENETDGLIAMEAALCRKHLLGEDVYVVDITRGLSSLKASDVHVETKPVTETVSPSDETPDDEPKAFSLVVQDFG